MRQYHLTGSRSILAEVSAKALFFLSPAVALDYLIFDATDNGDDTGTWEALASVDEAQWPALWAEAQALLALAQRQAPGPRGPQEEGGAWDDADRQERHDGQWHTLTVTLTGPWAWGEALLAGQQADR